MTGGGYPRTVETREGLVQQRAAVVLVHLCLGRCHVVRVVKDELVL